MQTKWNGTHENALENNKFSILYLTDCALKFKLHAISNVHTPPHTYTHAAREVEKINAVRKKSEILTKSELLTLQCTRLTNTDTHTDTDTYT